MKRKKRLYMIIIELEYNESQKLCHVSSRDRKKLISFIA